MYAWSASRHRKGKQLCSAGPQGLWSCCRVWTLPNLFFIHSEWILTRNTFFKDSGTCNTKASAFKNAEKQLVQILWEKGPEQETNRRSKRLKKHAKGSFGSLMKLLKFSKFFSYVWSERPGRRKQQPWSLRFRLQSWRWKQCCDIFFLANLDVFMYFYAPCFRSISICKCPKDFDGRKGLKCERFICSFWYLFTAQHKSPQVPEDLACLCRIQKWRFQKSWVSPNCYVGPTKPSFGS